MSGLTSALSELLMHHFDEPVIVKTDDGTAGVALILDGWYAPGADEIGAGAEATLEFWRDRITRMLVELELEKALT